MMGEGAWLVGVGMSTLHGEKREERKGTVGLSVLHRTGE